MALPVDHPIVDPRTLSSHAVNAGIEEWVAALIRKLDLNIHLWGTLDRGKRLWACMDDCSCLFVVDDGDFLDRFALVTDDGPCPDYQDCPCHALPRRNPAVYPEGD